MKILHIVRRVNDRLALEVIQNEQRRGGVTVLLLQDGVLSKGTFPEETYVCQEDLDARGAESPFGPVNYDTIARLIAEHDRVRTW